MLVYAMPKLQEITVTKLTLEETFKKGGPDLQQLEKLAPLKDLLKQLVDRPRYRVSFVVDGARRAYANAFRMTMIDYIETWAMEFRLDVDFDSNDYAALSEAYLCDVRLLSIDQDYDYSKGFKASLNVVNNSRLPRLVKSDDIVTEPDGLLAPGIAFGYLAPKKWLKIKEFQVVKRMGYQHAAHTPADGTPSMKPLDVEPWDELTGKGVPSSLADPRRHLVTYETKFSTRRPLWIAIAACDYVLREVAAIKEALKEGDINRVLVRTELDTKVYIIDNTYIHIGDLLVAAIHDLRPDVGRTSCDVEHHEKQTIQIIMYDVDHAELLQAACDEVIKHFGAFKATFTAASKA